MHSKHLFIGIDIGSVSLSLAVLDSTKNLIDASYIIHRGDIRGAFQNAIAAIDLEQVIGIGATTSTPAIIKADKRFDNRVALIEGTRRFQQGFRAVLTVGGERFGLIQFDAEENYLNYKTNTSCAAGTGSFLDQQAGRLNLENIAALSQIALQNSGEIPKIASRCAVFAKTDLIHAQQEGYTLPEICDGLCYGLSKNIVDTLFGGDPTPGPVLFVGGVARNKTVLKHIRALTGLDIFTDEKAHLYEAIGASLHLIDSIAPVTDSPKIISDSKNDLGPQATKTDHFEPLTLAFSDYPDFSDHIAFEHISRCNRYPSTVEVDLYTPLITGKTYPVYLGIDIGSTSSVIWHRCNLLL